MIAIEETNQTAATELPLAFLVFELSNSHYAIRIEEVREIITTITISRVPGSPPYLSGVTNLRGRILPIIDLRKKFDFEDVSSCGRECYVVLAIQGPEGLLEFGICVDSVCEVTRIKPSQIDSAPSVNTFGNQLMFNGVVHTPTGVRLILDTFSLVTQLQDNIQTLGALHRHPTTTA